MGRHGVLDDVKDNEKKTAFHNLSHHLLEDGSDHMLHRQRVILHDLKTLARLSYI